MLPPQTVTIPATDLRPGMMAADGREIATVTVADTIYQGRDTVVIGLVTDDPRDECFTFINHNGTAEVLAAAYEF